MLGQIYGISGKKIFRWYQELSGYLGEQEDKRQALKTKQGKPRKKLTKKLLISGLKKVWKPSNFGTKMAIDEKHIGGVFYTIITNLKTKKVAAILKTVRGKELKECLYTLPRKIRWNVKTLTRDLAGVFENVGDEIFKNSFHVADKFHVLRLGFEAIQSVRIRYRQEVLTNERLRIEDHKEKEAKRREEAKKNRKSFSSRCCSPMNKLRNGETELQLLARSRFLLFKYDTEWNNDQKERADILFKKYPDLKKAYKIIKKFRSFYNIKNKKNIPYAREKLKEWFKYVGAAEISEIQNFASTVSRHQIEILNYFEDGDTNAIAESINNKIQRFLINNYGTRDPNFFFFRLKHFLS